MEHGPADIRAGLLLLVICHTMAPNNAAAVEGRGLFSPRMDYEEWTPLGRGDPLKNDPTFDYVPPVLERVHYWLEPSSRTPDPPSLSVTTTTSTTEPPHIDSRRDNYDPFFLKFVDGPKFSSNPHYSHSFYRRPASSPVVSHHYVPYHSTYKNHPYYSSSEKKQQQPYRTTLLEAVSDSSSSSTSEKRHTFGMTEDSVEEKPRPPYTVLVPPPLQIPDAFSSVGLQKPIQVASTTTAVPSEVVFEHHSTAPSLSGFWEDGKTQLATLASSYVPWKDTTPPATLGQEDNIIASGINAHGSLRPTHHTTMHHHYIHHHHHPSPFLYSSSSAHTSSDVEVLPSTELHFSSDNLLMNMTSSSPAPPGISSTPVTATTAGALTTDPLFAHYKQPAEPLRGPMYLIIQGHSKVKTYGANKNSFHGIPIQESNDIRGESDGHPNDRSGKAMDDYEEDNLVNDDDIPRIVMESTEVYSDETLFGQDSSENGDLLDAERDVVPVSVH